MQIIVKLINGRNIEFEVEATETILDIKNRLEESEGISALQQRLLLGGRQLKDEQSLEELKVQPGATFNLVLALRGGF